MDMPRSPTEGRMKLASLELGGPFEGISLAYVDWGQRDADRVVVCVHGLTRNARDFDVLAESLVRYGVRVLAVDVVGRGRSSWLDDPAGYVVPNYAGQIARLLALLGVTEADWVGTSMGGIIGMGLAAQDPTPIRRLVLNDVGPFVPVAALRQIQSYLGLDLKFRSLEELEQHLRFIHSGFGQLSDPQWQHLARHSGRETAEGWRLSYDPAIRVPYDELAEKDIDIWELWDGIRCPTFVLRGADSELLTPEITAEMRVRGPKAEVMEVPDVGHAPALMAPDQIKTIENWLGLRD